jgi:hypothetical protein
MSAPLPSRLDRVPSFQTLQQEPLQRGAIIIATVLAVSAFATFRFVIGLPNPYFSEPQHGPISPIQSVIEHLNQPISPDSVENNGDSSASTQASPEAVRSEAGPSPMNALPSTGPSTRAVNAVNESAQPREQNPNASYSNQRSSLAAVPPSLLAKGQSEPIGEAERGATSAYASTRSPAAAVADLSGRWSTSFGEADGDADIPQWFLFKQDRGGLTGIGGPNSTQGYPIIRGLVDGSSVSFELSIRKRRFLYNLRFEDETMRGTLSVSGANEMRSTAVWLRHVR